MAVYGNSYNNTRSDASITRTPVFGGDVRLYPSGAYVPVDSTNTVGKVYPAGTPVTVSKVGEAPTFNGGKPTGLLYQDVTIGNNGASVDIVVSGEFYQSLSKAEITEEQEEYLNGRITFIKEG